jgi:hypothetical protein
MIGPTLAERIMAMTSGTASSLTRRWTVLHEFVTEVSDSRIRAGFHYRFSARGGQDMVARLATTWRKT